MKKTLIILAVLIMISLAFGAGYMLSQKEPAAEPTEEEVVEEEIAEEEVIEEATETEEAVEKTTSVDTEIVMADYKDSVLAAYNEIYAYGDAATWEDIDDLFSWYTYEPDEDTTILTLNLACEGPCSSPYIYRFFWEETEAGELMTFLPQYSNEYISTYIEPLTEYSDGRIYVEGLEAPESISIPGTEEIISLAQTDDLFLTTTTLEVAFEDDAHGTVYSGPNSCFYYELDDGSVARYEYDPGFFGSDDDEHITWLNGDWTSLTDSYYYLTGGCGISGNCYLLSDVKDTANLEFVGTTDSGIDLYTVANPYEGAVDDPEATNEQAIYDDAYNTYTSMYAWSVENEGLVLMTFEEFVALTPLLFWEDPFGRWAEMRHNDVKPAAECGKPVVYLYPEEPMDVSVKVLIDELTVTDPYHGEDGWFVKAFTDGTIFNYADSKTYPYLFWEGHKNGGLSPTKGFVIAREDVEKFLDNSLTKMGLNETEEYDFMDFWLSRILENDEPYFLFSFFGTQEFNKIAPLEITPEPDTLIRVFMYYEPLDKPVFIMPQALGSVDRKGFTVVEWGGTSSIQWKK